MKSILIVGAEGYLGHHVEQHFEGLGWTVHCTGLGDSKRANYHCLDITARADVVRIVQTLRPEIVVHAAGLSSLALCEKEPERARAVNVGGTRNLIEAIRPLNNSCKLVFLSSDYVFAGREGNYAEESERNPQTEYGKTKLTSEDDIRAALPNSIILRMSNVYGHGGHFYNFVHGSLAAGRPVELFADTCFTPVSIDYLVRAMKVIFEKDFSGVLHLAGPERLSRHEFGLKVAEQLNADAGLVQAVCQPAGGLIAPDNSLCIRKASALLPLYNPPVIKALHAMAGLFTYPHLHFKDERGLLHGISQGRNWEEMNYAETRAGTVRGGHYHGKTTEGFYVVRGRLQVWLRPVKGDACYGFIAEAGDSFLIPPLTVHTFEILEDTAWINYLSQAMDNKDPDIRKA